MDRLLKLEPSNQVAIRIEPDQQCYGSVTLRNVMFTMPVAFRLLPLNRARFTVRPQTGIIGPLANLTVEITYLPPPPPAPLLPDWSPDSDDSFYLDSVVAPGAVKEGATFSSLDAVPSDRFATKKKQVFTDSGLRILFVGSVVLHRLVATGGDMEKVRRVLEASDPAWRAADSADEQGKALLHQAISRGRADLVQLLLEFGADVNTASRAGRSPIEEAAVAGEELIAELLLARGASTERSPWSILGPLHLAALEGHTEVLRLLLIKGAAVESPAPDGRTALHLAAEEGRRECAALLLEAGAQANTRGGAAWNTPLHLAAVAGDAVLVRMMVEKGCAGLKEVRNGAGKTAYELAVEEGKGKRNIFDLLRLGQDLAAAARKGNGREAVMAIQMGAAVDGRDGMGWTALMRAGFKGRVEVIKILLEKGAVMEIRDDEGYTALHCAAEAGQAEAVEMLVKRGADTEARTAKGRTPVEIAAALGFAGIVRILVQGGATPVVAPTAPPTATSAARNVSVLLQVPAKSKKKVGKKASRIAAAGGFVNRSAPLAVASC
ncbi:E3 ubiquitin-protein ligase KEG [Apostasia shenzhenica]|uniref:E3 ubiquitin-protein ligase KEG n=1 Tax=Apostasia shenzhenica TaxID=1088818 RepID=A0A2H9ZRA3_9ASPA|nr:E3 ubiquitin-protein ligase KEG [Apostasia shenzhenica]